MDINLTMDTSFGEGGEYLSSDIPVIYVIQNYRSQKIVSTISNSITRALFDKKHYDTVQQAFVFLADL